jgi:hypothetical protein
MRASQVQELVQQYFGHVEGFLAVVTQWITLPTRGDDKPGGYWHLTVNWTLDCSFVDANQPRTPAQRERGEQPNVHGEEFLKCTIDAEWDFTHDPRARSQFWEFLHLGNSSARKVTLQAEKAAEDRQAPPGSVQVIWGRAAREPEPALAGADRRDYGQNWGA